MDPIDLSKVFSGDEAIAFYAIRGKAIHAYASVEQSLCRLFGYLTDMRLDVAAIVFFKIVSANTLFGILQKLLKKKHGAMYCDFWKSFFKELHKLNEERNHIVHGNVSRIHYDMTQFEYGLRPSNFFDRSPDSWLITTPKLLEFMEKCAFLAHLCHMFVTVHAPMLAAEMGAGQEQTWRGIFLQAIVYPNPHNHPKASSPTEQAPESPPLPSPA